LSDCQRGGSTSNPDRSGQRPELVVGLLADPDLPIVAADRVRTSLPRALASLDDSVEWTVQSRCDPFGVLSSSTARERVQHTDWDFAVCLTGTPMLDHSQVIAAQARARDRATLLSLPALGGLPLTRSAEVLISIGYRRRDQGSAGLGRGENTAEVRNGGCQCWS
jgi:hypothetical protein